MRWKEGNKRSTQHQQVEEEKGGAGGVDGSRIARVEKLARLETKNSAGKRQLKIDRCRSMKRWNREGGSHGAWEEGERRGTRDKEEPKRIIAVESHGNGGKEVRRGVSEASTRPRRTRFRTDRAIRQRREGEGVGTRRKGAEARDAATEENETKRSQRAKERAVKSMQK